MRLTLKRFERYYPTCMRMFFSGSIYVSQENKFVIKLKYVVILSIYSLLVRSLLRGKICLSLLLRISLFDCSPLLTIRTPPLAYYFARACPSKKTRRFGRLTDLEPRGQLRKRQRSTHFSTTNIVTHSPCLEKCVLLIYPTLRNCRFDKLIKRMLMCKWNVLFQSNVFSLFS